MLEFLSICYIGNSQVCPQKYVTKFQISRLPVFWKGQSVWSNPMSLCSKEMARLPKQQRCPIPKNVGEWLWDSTENRAVPNPPQWFCWKKMFKFRKRTTWSLKDWTALEASKGNKFLSISLRTRVVPVAFGCCWPWLLQAKNVSSATGNPWIFDPFWDPRMNMLLGSVPSKSINVKQMMLWMDTPEVIWGTTNSLFLWLFWLSPGYLTMATLSFVECLQLPDKEDVFEVERQLPRVYIRLCELAAMQATGTKMARFFHSQIIWTKWSANYL